MRTQSSRNACEIGDAHAAWLLASHTVAQHVQPSHSDVIMYISHFITVISVVTLCICCIVICEMLSYY